MASKPEEMEKYESKITTIPAPIEQVYAVLGNMRSLEKVRHLIPEDKVQELEIGDDYLRMKVEGLGQKICIRMVERTSPEQNGRATIKFGGENAPIEANFWIQLIASSAAETRCKLTFGAEIPLMFRMMVGGKIKKGLDDGADMLTQFPYAQWLA